MEEVMRCHMTFLIASALSLCLINCALPQSKMTTKESVSLKYPKVSINQFKADLIKFEEPIINATEIKLNGIDETNSLQFLDMSHGWIGSKKALYKTSDGGHTWEQLNINVPSDSHISSFFFTSEEQGWLAMVTK